MWTIFWFFSAFSSHYHGERPSTRWPRTAVMLLITPHHLVSAFLLLSTSAATFMHPTPPTDEPLSAEYDHFYFHFVCRTSARECKSFRVTSTKTSPLTWPSSVTTELLHSRHLQKKALLFRFRHFSQTTLVRSFIKRPVK